jgi:hypothetical protein
VTAIRRVRRRFEKRQAQVLFSSMQHQSIPNQRLAPLVIMGLLLLLSALSMRPMATNSLWFDEVWSLRYAGGAQYGPISLTETINRVIEQMPWGRNPPGYFLLLNLWGRVAGWSEFAGWMLSLLIGLVAVAMMYRLGHDLTISYGRPAANVIGVSAAVALGLSAFFVQYLYEMRPYVLVVLLTIGYVWMYWRLIDTDRKPGLLLQSGYVLTIVVMLYTHYTLLFVLAAVGVYHLFCVPKTVRWWQVVLLTGIGGLSSVPWGLVMLDTAHRVGTTPLVPVTMSPGEIIEDFTSMFSNGNVGLLALLVIFALKARGRPARFAWVIFVACLLATMLISTLVPTVSNIRYVLVLWPIAALLVALGIDQLRRRAVNPAWILAIWTAAGLWIYLNPTFANTQHDMRLPWKTFRAELQKYEQPGDVVLFHTPFAVWSESTEFAHYTYGLPIRGSLTEDLPGKQPNNEYFNTVRAYVGSVQQVWLGVEQSQPPNFRLGEVQHLLADGYQHCFTAFDLPLMRLELYARNLTNPQARFGDQIGVGLLGPLKPQADQTLPVLLGFSHPADTPPDTYSVAVHVEDETGQLKAQSDFGLAPGVNSCQMVSIPIRNLPPGKYTVLIAVYEWRTGKRLAGQMVATGASGDRLAFGTFTIAP